MVQERIKGKGKGKEMLYRYEGEVVGPAEPDQGFKEEEIVVRDPRKEIGFKRPPTLRPMRTEFIEIKYEYDINSTGPPPPTSVLITNISPLTPNNALRQYLGQHGNVVSYEPQVDNQTGGAIGVLFLKYSTHEEAKRCVQKENGKKGGLQSNTLAMKPGEVEEWKVVFDGEGVKLKAVMRELVERKKREKEAQRRGPSIIDSANAVASGSSSAAGNVGGAGTPMSGMQSPAPRRGQPTTSSHLSRPSQRAATDKSNGHHTPLQHPLPQNPMKSGSNVVQKPSQGDANEQTQEGDKVPIVVAVSEPKPLDALVQARLNRQKMNLGMPSSTAPGVGRGRTMLPVKYGAYKASPMNASRSPSPSIAAHKPGMNQGPKSVADREKAHQEVVRELAQNGHDHVKVQGGVQLVASVKDEDVRNFFEGFNPDKVLRDHTGLYVTFTKAGVAQRATNVLGSGTKQLGYQSVTLSAHPPPVYESTAQKTSWTEMELIEEAQKLIVRELTDLLQKDISERIVGQDLKKLIVEAKSRGPSAMQNELKPVEKKGLKGLSFKKAKKVKAVVEVEKEDMGDGEMDVDRPKKKRKKEVKKIRRVIDDEDLESEDEDEADTIRLAALDSEDVRKRAVSEDHDEEDEPVKKKQKVLEVTVKGKKSLKKLKQDLRAGSVDAVVLGDAESFDSPAITKLRLLDGFGSSLSPSRSPSPEQLKRRKRPVTPLPTPPPDPVGLGLCEDDEDLYFAKLALSFQKPVPEKAQAPPSSSDAPTFRQHKTGSARTEGYYKITHAEKMAYVVQYQARAANSGSAPVVEEPQPQHIHTTSSRSNRANARRRAQGLEEINQVQRAVALSKGETAANELTFKFNQLQTRKKHLRFARSPIHDWGLYAMEKISRGEMVIEYVGEVIRAQVADKREKAYERQGIGSSYLFRIDEDLVVDATKKGNLGRLINHSCDPNCTAKIIAISGEKKIVIYAKQDIELGDEITYDYHFPFEQDKIPCLCGSAKCRGYLN
ncbi:hypothetical protein B0H34DRAFT_663177 [Crassisporium funariophilum]|nr:hypothetical protein B0H34DRAFT_663177 [Crassisporium funariophilum]